jgi:hypothetical protein
MPAMAELPEESFDTAVALLQQFRELAQLNSQALDDATNRQMLRAVEASISDVMRQAGINLLSIERQQEQENARQAALRTPRRRRRSSTDGQSPDHKRQRLSVRLRDRARSVDTSPSSSPERIFTLEQKLEGLHLAEHVIAELRRGAEHEPLARAPAFAAPVPPKRLKPDGKQQEKVHTDTVFLRAHTDNTSS